MRDIAVAATNANAVTILYGNTVLGFSRVDVPAGNFPVDVGVADFTGDGRVDLAVAAAGDSAVQILAGGAGRVYTTVATIDVGPGLRALDVADVDTDGRPDVLVVESTNISSGFIGKVVARKADGSFFVIANLATGVAPASIVAADLDGDGAIDAVIPNEGSDTVSLLLGDGAGTFSSKRIFEFPGVPFAVATGRFHRPTSPDGDRKLDLVASNFDSNFKLVFLQGNGAGGIADQGLLEVLDPDHPNEGFAGGLAVADFDGDGVDDVAATASAAEKVKIVLVGGSNGPTVIGNYDVGSRPFGIVTGDFDSDGRPDLAVTAEGSNEVRVLVGLGGGVFGQRAGIAIGQAPWRLATADLNHDGHLDLVVAVDGGVDVLLGNGAAAFSSPIHAASSVTPGRAMAVAVTDLDGDPHPDLVVANFGAETVGLLRGHGDGTFTLIEEFPVGHRPRDVIAVDLNGDRRNEIVVASETSDLISIFFLNPTGQLVARRDLDVGHSPTAIAAGDFDGDDRPDLFVPAFFQSGITLLKNLIPDRADVNASNVVDGFDVNRVALAFGAKIGMPGYAPELDVVTDGQVDGYDVALFTPQFGKPVRTRAPFEITFTVPAQPVDGTVKSELAVSAGDTLKVAVTVDTTSPVAGADLLFSYDPTVLDFVTWNAGTFFSGLPVAYPVVEPSPGLLEIGAVQVTSGSVDIVRNGPTVLVELVFRALRAGDTDIDFGSTSVLRDSAKRAVAVAFVDGSHAHVAAASGGGSGLRLTVRPLQIELGTLSSLEPIRAKLRLTNFGPLDQGIIDVQASSDVVRVPHGASFSVPPSGYIEVPVTIVPSSAGPIDESLTFVLPGSGPEAEIVVPVRGTAVLPTGQGR
jgi:hypothetical protein